MSKIVKMINKLNSQAGPIPTPTYKQAFLHLANTVALADKQGVKSMTIEAMRVVVDTLQAPPKTPLQ